MGSESLLPSRLWWPRLTAALALAPAVTLMLLHWHLLPPIATTDYAQYILHAKALLEGRPYGDTGYLFTSYAPHVGPRLLPPGLPLTLAPIIAIVGSNSPLLRLVEVGSLIAFGVLVWQYLSTRESPLVAAGVTAMLLVSLESSYASTVLLSDPGFCALLWALIITVDGGQGRWSWGRVAGVTVLGFMALSYRVAGVAIVPAVGIWAVLNRRRTGPRAMVPAIVWSAAAVAVAVLGFALPAAPSGLREVGFEVLWERVTSSVREYRLAVFDSQLYPFAVNALNDAYHGIAALLSVVGAVHYLRVRPWQSFLFVFSATYCVMILLTPVRDWRYLWPLYPVVLLFFLTGLRIVVSFALRPRRRVAEWVTVGAAAAVTLLATVRIARQPDPPSLLGLADVQDLFDRVRETSQGRLVRYSFLNPRVLTLEAGVEAMPWFAAASLERALTEFEDQGITHLVLGDIGVAPDARVFLEKLVAAHPARFTLEYENRTFRVLRFHRAREAPAAAS